MLRRMHLIHIILIPTQVAYQVNGKRLVAHLDPARHPLKHPDDFVIEHHQFMRAADRPLERARTGDVIDPRRVGHIQVHHALEPALNVKRLGVSRAANSARWNLVQPGKLRAARRDQARLERAERHIPTVHVRHRRNRPPQHRSTRLYDLSECDMREDFGVLLHEQTRERHRRGRPRHRLRRNNDRLIVLHIYLHAVPLRRIYLQGTHDAANAHQARPLHKLAHAAERHRHHIHHVLACQVAERAAAKRFPRLARPQTDRLHVDGGHRDIVRPQIHLIVRQMLELVDQDEVLAQILQSRRRKVALFIQHVGRRAETREKRRLRINARPKLRVVTVKQELARRLLDRPKHNLPRYPNHLLRVIHPRAPAPEKVAQILRLNFYALPLQHRQRTLVNSPDLVLAENLESFRFHWATSSSNLQRLFYVIKTRGGVSEHYVHFFFVKSNG